MMFRIHFTVKGHEDHFDVVGSTIEEVTRKVEGVFATRGLRSTEVDAWSEEIPQ